MKFINFAGNEKVKDSLSSLVENNRFPHALIIEGDEGCGKRTLAKEIALNLFCRGEDKPCLRCPQCSKVLKNIHPDVIEYTAENRPDAFSVKTVRSIRESAFMSPNEADYKIYILGNAQSMSVQAQNALLKVLEEPPSYDIFILTVTNKAYMLETVLSRCVTFSLEGVSSAEGAKYISDNYDNISYDDAYKSLELCGGNIGKALDNLNSDKDEKINSLANEMAMGIVSDNEYELIKTCSNFEAKKNDLLILTLGELKMILRDALFINKKPVCSDSKTAQTLSSRLSREKIVKLISACDDLIKTAGRYVNNKIMITKACADLRRAAGR